IGGIYRKEVGVYHDTILGGNYYGCDSFSAIALSFIKPTVSFNQYSGCEGYSVTVGSNTYNRSGIYKDVVNQCDTVYTVLTIHPNPDFVLVKTDDECNQQIGS